MAEEKSDRDTEAFDAFNESVEALHEMMTSVTATPMDFEQAALDCHRRCVAWVASLPAQKT